MNFTDLTSSSVTCNYLRVKTSLITADNKTDSFVKLDIALVEAAAVDNNC